MGHGAFWHYLTGDVDELGNQKGESLQQPYEEGCILKISLGPYWNNVEWRSYHFSENGGVELKEDKDSVMRRQMFNHEKEIDEEVKY